MKKYIIIVSVLVALYFIGDYAFYHLGFYIDFRPNAEVTSFTKVDGTKILVDEGEGFKEFEIKGVNMGSGIPGEWSTDFAIDKETYLRWFGLIKEMGANTIRIYTIQSDDFYNAFYEFNHNNPDPLYLLHGVWVNDYVQFSHRDAYDDEFYRQLKDDCKTVIDVIHGKKVINIGRYASAGHGSYKNDISPWVIGYVLGVEWEGPTVIYTDKTYEENENYRNYRGKYMYTTEEATAFEAMLARIGDTVLEYESERYKTQKLVAFSNWPTTDPFEYPEQISILFPECASIDVEHIKCSEKVVSGQFASYHVYPYYPDFLNHISDWSEIGIEDSGKFITEDGKLNSYYAYLTLLTDHHTMPVVITEFGIPTGRGKAHDDANTDRHQGAMSENAQGKALRECYYDIKAAGCAGSCVFSWQDEWFKRTWNTMYAIDSSRNPYWSDYQTNEQFFGLLTFDPGEEESICYVDGDVSEWNEADVAVSSEDFELSIKYDEKFMYFLVHKENLDFENEKIYIPFDTTPKTGSSYCENFGIFFDRAADFVLAIDGKTNTRLLVQERYESLRSTYSVFVHKFDTYEKGNIPDKDSPLFVKINMILEMSGLESVVNGKGEVQYRPFISGEHFETGDLTYGNANPGLPDFDSLADFISSGDYIEIRIPWELFNFADPSRMEIHDDYYDGNYGVDYIFIDGIYAGISGGGSEERINLEFFPLEGWGNKVTSHERLKSAYYVMQELWK